MKGGLAAAGVALAAGALTLNQALVGVFYDDGLYAGLATALVDGMTHLVQFHAANGAGPTLNVNGLGAIPLYSYQGGAWATVAPGALTADMICRVAYHTSSGTYRIIGAPPTFPATLANSLGANVAMPNGSVYYDGPAVAQGSVGTWFVSGTITVQDIAGTSFALAKLWDGNTVIASTFATISSANGTAVISLSGRLASPAGNLRISCKDSSGNAIMLFSGSGEGKDCTITAYRIA